MENGFQHLQIIIRQCHSVLIYFCYSKIIRILHTVSVRSSVVQAMLDVMERSRMKSAGDIRKRNKR